MKIESQKIPMAKDNIFRIQNYEDYDEFVATASEGKNKAVQSFPWHHSILDGDPILERAKKICVDSTTASLVQYMNRKKNSECWLIRFLRREIGYMKLMMHGLSQSAAAKK